MTAYLHASNIKTTALKPSLAWLAVAAFIVFLFDPGIMSNDSFASLKQARTLQFTDWHPPVMAIIWSVLDKLIAGPAGMLLCQAMLYAYVCSALCAYAFPHLSRRFPSWLVVALFSLFPPAMTLAGMIWKDIWMSGFLLLALVHLFKLQASVPSGKKRKHALAVVVFCLAATAFRHNALAATAGLLAGAAFWLWPSLKLLPRFVLASIAGIGMAVLLYLCVSLANGMVARRAELTTAIYLHDIAGIIVYSGDPAASDMVLAYPAQLTDDKQKFVQRIYRSYTPAAAGRVLRSSRRPQTPFSINVFSLDHDATSVQKLRKQLIEKYPAAYLKHRTTAFACLLQLCKRDEWVYHSYVMNKQYALPQTLDNQSWQYALRKWFLSEKLARLYHPGFWLLVTLIGGALGFARLRKERPSLLLFMSLSSAGLALSLYFTSPIESYRYMHWTMLLGWTMLFLAADDFLARRHHLAASPNPSRPSS